MPNELKPVVLVADDEPSMVAMLSSHLRSKGYTVLEASDGDQAWELAHEHLPNLVLLDVMMPGMSGWEVCRKIREAVSLAHTGVIMLTGIGENLNEMTSPLYGADAYLDKPFEFSDLDQKISETITRRADGALGRADRDGEEGPVKKTLRRAGKAKPEVAEKQQLPAAKATKKAAAPKAETAPEPKPDAKAEPKPALAKAVARPAPKQEKPVAKTKVKAAPPLKAGAKLAQPVPKAAKPAPKPSKPTAKAKAPAKAASKAAKKPERKPVKASPKPAPKPPKQPPKPAKKAQKPSPRPLPKPAKPAPKPVKNAAPERAKKAAKPAKKTTKKR